MNYGYIVLIAVIGTAVGQKSIAFKSCGGGEVKAVRVNPCTTEPCQIPKGNSAEIEVDFVANQDEARPKLRITANVEGTNVKFPGLKEDACIASTGLSCPLKNSETYTFKHSLKILPFFPNIKTQAKIRIQGTKGDIICFEAPVEVV